MGLLQRAIETYDAMEGLAGIYEEGKEPLAPIGHGVTKAQIEVTIDAEGGFVAARAADKNLKIIIPVSEESAGRTSSPAAHALCEQLGYLLQKDEEKHSLYMNGLRQWVKDENTHPKAAAVLRYMESGRLENDLKRSGIPVDHEKDLVCWRIVGLSVDSGPVWTDTSLMKAYTDYYLSQRAGERQICMLTGEETGITWQHLKGAFSLNGNAKIISANDAVNFTYRGRFTKPGEAASVGYMASQKAHNALKWLISTQGTIQGNRAFVCWNPQGLRVPELLKPILFQFEEEQTYPTYRSYRDDLRKKITGYSTNWEPESQVVVAAFDAATTGRLAITYYNELLGSDFLERLEQWDATCCWIDHHRGVYSPALYRIICFAFGTQKGDAQKGERVEPDEKIVAPHMQRLLACRIDQAAFPLDVMRAMVTRAGNLQAYNRTNREALLFTVCAVIRKYYIDNKKEEIALALEPNRRDRSYQWGRMLAVMEKIERDTYDDTEKREPNAVRMQQIFVQRPGYAAKLIMDQLKSAYYPRLPVGLRIKYDRLIGEIMEQLSAYDAADYGKPLTEMYLPGYYLQKQALYAAKNNNQETEEESHEI